MCWVHPVGVSIQGRSGLGRCQCLRNRHLSEPWFSNNRCHFTPKAKLLGFRHGEVGFPGCDLSGLFLGTMVAACWLDCWVCQLWSTVNCLCLRIRRGCSFCVELCCPRHRLRWWVHNWRYVVKPKLCILLFQECLFKWCSFHLMLCRWFVAIVRRWDVDNPFISVYSNPPDRKDVSGCSYMIVQVEKVWCWWFPVVVLEFWGSRNREKVPLSLVFPRGMLPVWKNLAGWVSRFGVRWFKSLPPVLSFRVSRICFGGISGYEGHDRGPSKWLSLCLFSVWTLPRYWRWIGYLWRSIMVCQSVVAAMVPLLWVGVISIPDLVEWWIEDVFFMWCITDVYVRVWVSQFHPRCECELCYLIVPFSFWSFVVLVFDYVYRFPRWSVVVEWKWIQCWFRQH